MNTAARAPAPAGDVDALLKSIRIPPRPSLLAELQRELASPEPSGKAMARIIAADVAMSASLLKLANSPFYGGRMNARSVDQAIVVLGINQIASMMTGLLARQAIGTENSLAGFWEVSTQRAQAMVHLARRLHLFPADLAHTFGLFCDTGIPLLMERFPGYEQTLDDAAHEATLSHVQVEDARHSTNHAAIGCLLARTWGLPAEVAWAILHHHDYAVIDDGAAGDTVRALVAASLVAELAIRRFQGHAGSPEWDKGGAAALRWLGLSEEDTADLLDDLLETFHGGD